MRRRAAVAAMGVLIPVLAAGCQDNGKAPTVDPSGTTGKRVTLSFLAYGQPEETAAYESMVDTFNREHPGITVKLEQVADPDEVIERVRGGEVPDIYMLSRRDLAEVAGAGLSQPLDELLDSRGVDFSDLYKRDALQAFSLEEHLQCMPYGSSPMVIYYNTNLIDFDTMEEQGLAHPSTHNSWTFTEFAAAATFATRGETKGLHIEPSLAGLAPFIYSGGGKLFDDDKNPTTLALSGGDSRAALNRTLQLLRTEQVTLTPKQLREESALDRFKTGKLGMIAGFRSLVPELRKTPSLSFDVMPMPMLDKGATVGEVTGLCVSSKATSVSAAADFIVHAISAEAVADVAEAGFLVPSNNEVAQSEAFLQPDQLPANPDVFNRAGRDIIVPPVIPAYAELEKVVHPLIYQLFYASVIDIDEVTAMIDEASKPIIAPPEPTDSASPSESASS